MKKTVSIALTLVLATIVVGTSAFAFEASADAYIGVYSKYLWRGYDLNEEDDDAVIQPGVDVSVGNVTFSFWGNISESSGEMNEVDLTVDYSQDLGEMFSFSVGNILYNVDTNDAEPNTTNEVYLGVTLNTLLAPTLTVYYDYDEFHTVYTTLGISHSFGLNDKLALGLGATGSYLNADEDYEWLHSGEISATLDYAINDNITASGMVLYSTPLSDDARDLAKIDDESTAGVSISYAF
jgi:hypothetical protein